MTVSNVFNGKKVVQQIYLGQTKIWQSLGWETTPSSCLQVWQKKLATVINTISIGQDKIYIATNQGPVIRCDSDGNKILQFTFYYLYGAVIASDSQGNMYIANVSSNNFDIAKYSSDGTKIWQRTISDGNTCTHIAICSNGNIYCCSTDLYRLNNSGDVVWKRNTSEMFANNTSIAVDSMENVYLSATNKTLLRFDSNGNQIWQQKPSDSYINTVTTDNQDFIYTGDNHSNITKLDVNGNQIWQKVSNSTKAINIVKTDSQDNIYSGDDDGNVTKYSSDGTKIWNQQLPAAILALDIDSQDNIYAGDKNGNVTKLLNITATQ